MREMNLQLQEVKKIMSSVNNNNKKNPQTHQDQNSENKEKGCQEKKTTTTYYIQMCLDWKKRSANIEFYTQTAILSKGINKGKEMATLCALKMDLSEWTTSPDWCGKSVANVCIGGTALVVQWLRLCALNAGGLDLIPHAAAKDPAYSTKIQQSKINNKLKTN